MNHEEHNRHKDSKRHREDEEHNEHEEHKERNLHKVNLDHLNTFCREIESYLCRKNDGHLIRVTGPSFDLVSGWARRGVPLKVAFKGIDRYVERYYRKGTRRRPVKIDFCEADVLDVFDEWRRATGVGAPAGSSSSTDATVTLPSLTAHLKRVLVRLTSARASDAIPSDFDGLIDRVAAELDAARSKSRGVRGAERDASIERLATLDGELLRAARTLLDESALAELAREADEELAPFRGMTAEAFARAREGAINRLVRERFGLPIIALR
jgi:hypothetical protein